MSRLPASASWAPALIGGLLLLSPVAPAAASVPVSTRVVVEAAVPAGDAAAAGAQLRQQALQAGIEDAVREVTRRYAVPVEGEEDPLAALAAPARDFVLRYRVVEQIGERPAGEGPPGGLEYAARVEVDVDTPRLTRALARTGRAAIRTEDAAASTLYRIAAPLRWREWVRFERALRAAGATRAVPHEVDAEGMVIRVETVGDPDIVLRRVRDAPPEGLVVEWAGPPSRDLTLRTLAPETPATRLSD